ncbi:hypothetical protein SVTN_39985 (plasmid) [Streptomyces vietnamensis]|uniref:Integral membrane protein n=2 Tax=Streptomyces vietnamensis TaxID=362257 RepID=A0A0B5ICY2_9ACTN|nr:hypothetical protein SVTN_39985 [Streptomyces vietnamensis]
MGRPTVALVLLLMLLFAAAPPAASAPADECQSTELATASVSAGVLLEHGNRTSTKVRSELRVEVPADWPFARHLLLSEESPEYIRAMACITRPPHNGQYRRWSEWRDGPPLVTAEKDGGVTVVDRAHTWVNVDDTVHAGLWSVRADGDRWTVRLLLPRALAGAHWTEIKVDPGGPGAETATPLPDGGEGATALLWHPASSDKASVAEKGKQESGKKPLATEPVPAVTVRLKPSWQRSWSAQSNRPGAVLLNRSGYIIASIVTSVLLLCGVVLYRRRPAPPTARQDRTLRNLAQWAVASTFLALLTDGRAVFQRYGEHWNEAFWRNGLILRDHGFALAFVAVLLFVARPTRRTWAALAGLTVPPLLVAVVPGTFDLRHEASGLALAATATASLCLFSLCSLAWVAAAWRLATDGGLLPGSRRFPGNDRVLKLRLAGPAILAWTIFVSAFFVLTEERAWQRASWLSDRTVPEYGLDHWNDFVWEALSSVPGAQDWLSSYLWLLTTIAMLAVLRAWRSATTVSPLEEPADRLLFITFFGVVGTLPGGYVAGFSTISVLWQLFGMLALYGFVAPFTGRSVLSQPLEGSGHSLATVVAPAGRAALLDKSRSYREIHAELRRLDQGLFGDVPPKRSDLEQNLSDLHNWPASPPLPGGADRLPAKVSVVDAALALGPRDTWWANGSRCARLSLVPAVPASFLMIWVWHIRGEGWTEVLSDQFGVPSLLLSLVSWAATWTGAAFVLGALWRQLPGQRGAAKALPVTLAFALPVAADGLVLHFTEESTAGLAFAVSAMLFVLTVTGIAMDFDTFRTERRYWQSRMGLLLSVYQMRYYSLQFAYLIAQIVAMISIWQFLAEPDAAPQPPEPKG